ncbi:MAG: pitrilysin family protein [Chlamydiales bacterium]|nr:pitrilysin family protein [Chlamydiales bacterium]
MVDIPKEKIKWSALSSGLRLVTVEMPNFYTVSAGLFAYVGSRFEKKQDVGISHLIEHLLFKGSKKYSSKAISEIIEGRGGFFNAYTAEENSCFYFKTLQASFFESLDVLIDFYTAPLFDPVEVDKEREVIIEEIHSYEDQPSSYVEDLFSSVIWKNHSLGNLILGNEENILRFTVEDIKNYFNKHYTSCNTVLAVAGCVTHEEVLSWLKNQEYRFCRGERNSFESLVVSQCSPRVLIMHKDIEQCNIQLGVPTLGRFSQKQWALRLLSTIAGENMSSRLFQEIREKRGLAYNISSSVDFYYDVGMFTLQVGVDVEKIEVCLQESLKVLQELATTTLLDDELKRAKLFSVGQALQDMESTLSYMLWVGEKLLNNEIDFSTAEFCKNIETVTGQDVQCVAKEIFCTERLSLALIGPYSASYGENSSLVSSLKFS